MSTAVPDLVLRLGGPPPRLAPPPPFLIVDATGDRRRVDAYRAMRRACFVEQQGLFAAHDLDERDEHPRTRVLVAVGHDGVVAGGVRIHSVPEDADLGWWRGSRLVVEAESGITRARMGSALVRAACAAVLDEGALRFDAHVQSSHRRFFGRLGWDETGALRVHGVRHVAMRFPIERIAGHAAAAKRMIGDLLDGVLAPGPWLGDDGVPVEGTDAVACVDAITPSMVERDPEWAGWCGVLVTAHDLSAMGARPVGMLDALAARDRAAAERVIAGLRRGAEAMQLPILGGHTQLGVPAALSVTGLGRTDRPVPAGGARAGDDLALCADVAGGWRPGYRGRQWDSTSWREAGDLREMLAAVPRARPAAAKDVSMAGIAGTAGMLAEAAGCGAEIRVGDVPRPDGARMGDWLTCFPGFAMVSADRPGAAPPCAGPARTAVCGTVTAEPGVRLVWPDGVVTEAITGGVTGLGSTTGGTT